MNTDKEKELTLRNATKPHEQPGSWDTIANSYRHVSLNFLPFSSSVFICVHLWFQRFTS